MDTSIIIAGFSLALSGVEFLYQRFVANVQKDREYEHRFTILEDRVELYWKSVEQKLTQQIHSPHRPVIDALLDKINDDTITIDERAELRDLLLDGICEKSIEPYNCTAAETLAGIQTARVEFYLKNKGQKRE
jgi:hypothetical protein